MNYHLKIFVIKFYLHNMFMGLIDFNLWVRLHNVFIGVSLDPL